MKIKICDIILIVCLTLLCFIPLFFTGSTGKYATITVDGKTKAILPLDTDTSMQIDDIGTVVISKGKIRFENASCPDKSCEKTGEIYKEGQSIICLPNRIVIKIDGESGVDAIVQ